MSVPGQKAKYSLRAYVFRSAPAGSTGRRNTGVKSLCWGFKLQGLTWSFVELTSQFVQIGLRAHRQVGALREVLSQQTMVFSFDPRRHGLCGSQKYTVI